MSFLWLFDFAFSSSTGGAYATLCSLELALLEHIRGSETVAAITFGAPKVGNSCFSQTYDRFVPNHWRCVVAGDSTVSTPSGASYEHVGKAALFTRTGQLTLDKVARLRWWQSESSTFPMYKLTAYYCALETWSVVHSRQNAQAIGLWKWPLDATTSRLFPSRQRVKSESARPRSNKTTGTHPGPSKQSRAEPHDEVVAFRR